MKGISLIIIGLILALVAGLAGCTVQPVVVTHTATLIQPPETVTKTTEIILPTTALQTVTVTKTVEILPTTVIPPEITVTLPLPTVTPSQLLPEHRPQMPPMIVGSATLEPFGTNIMLDGFPASVASSEYFYYGAIAEDRYTKELLVNIIFCSDCPNSYKVREPGGAFFELRPCSGQGLWEFSPERLVYENFQTSKDGQILYTTEVMGILRSRGDFYKFQIVIANFDPRDKHEVSWEIYVWRET